MNDVYKVAYDVVIFINETEQPSNRLTSWEFENAVEELEHNIKMFIDDRDFNHIEQYFDRIIDEICNGNNNEAYYVFYELIACIAGADIDTIFEMFEVAPND